MIWYEMICDDMWGFDGIWWDLMGFDGFLHRASTCFKKNQKNAKQMSGFGWTLRAAIL